MTPTQAEAVLPSRDDPTVALASDAVGGPAGRHVRPGAGWWTPVRVLLAMVIAVFALGIAEKQYCRQDGWTTGGTTPYVHACYSDIPHMYRLRGFVEGKLPYIDTGDYERLEYPVVIGAMMAGAAAVARTADGVTAEAIRFFDLTAGLLLLCAIGTVIALSGIDRRRPWDAAMFALAPGFLLTATINWDLVALLFTALAMLAWARRHPALAGALIGIGTATKLYPVLLLGPLFLLCLRAGKLAAFLQALIAAAVAWLAVNLPVMAVAPEGWATFYTFSHERPADLGSVWFALTLSGHPVPAASLNTVIAVVLLCAFAGIGVLTLAAPRRPRFGQLVFLAVAAFVLANKVYSPQYVLWLIPLAPLARPRWREFLVWQACEVVYFFAVWLYLAGYQDANKALPATGYSLAILLHVLGTLYFAAFVVRDILRPEHDPIRADGSDDPAGGVLDGAPDVVAFTRPREAGLPSGDAVEAPVP